MYLIWVRCLLQVSPCFPMAVAACLSAVFPVDLFKYWKETVGTL